MENYQEKEVETEKETETGRPTKPQKPNPIRRTSPVPAPAKALLELNDMLEGSVLVGDILIYKQKEIQYFSETNRLHFTGGKSKGYTLDEIGLEQLVKDIK